MTGARRFYKTRLVVLLRAIPMRTKKTSSLTQLGKAVAIPQTPDAARLEAVPNPHPDADYIVRFTAPEFTCLCPVTGQPDFANGKGKLAFSFEDRCNFEDIVDFKDMIDLLQAC